MNRDVVCAPDGGAARGAYDALIVGQPMLSAHLDASYAGTSIAPRGFDDGRYVNPKVDALLREANAASDGVGRTRAYLAAGSIIAADVPEISAVHRPEVYAVGSRATGRPNRLTLFDEVMELDVR